MKCTSLILLCLLALPSCTTYFEQRYVGSESYVLAERTLPNGAHESYQLVPRSSVGEASLRVSSEYYRERPFLGFQLVELTKQVAEPRGVTPYTGLLVMGAYPQSSAKQGGVLAGDVLLSLDGRETVYLGQLAELEGSLHDGQVVKARLLRGQSVLEVALTTQLLRERMSDTQDVPLDPSPLQGRPYAGVALAGIPSIWGEKIYGQAREAVVVTSVEVGSPAWLAGVRGGDVIESVDGAPVPPPAELGHLIAERGARGESMHWSVQRGATMRHEATLQLSDYSGEANVWVPLVFRLVDGVAIDRWSVGPFGLLLSNRSRYVAESTNRTVETHSVFSALLGLVRVESAPEATHVRLLWLIHFGG